MKIRVATGLDAAAVCEIYRPYVESSSTSFELQVPSTDEMASRIAASLDRWSWLVAESDGSVVGYAYGTAHRQREAYRYSVETSAYVHPDHHRKGIARSLYEELFAQLRRQGYESAYAGITLPNDPSYAFHRSLGFEPIGVFPRIGRKFHRWHDVAWLHRPIGGFGKGLDPNA